MATGPSSSVRWVQPRLAPSARFDFSGWLHFVSRHRLAFPVLIITAIVLFVGLSKLHWVDDLSRLDGYAETVKADVAAFAAGQQPDRGHAEVTQDLGPAFQYHIRLRVLELFGNTGKHLTPALPVVVFKHVHQLCSDRIHVN